MQIKLKFRPTASHISTIGKGLIKDNYSALIELIKNSYDADSPNVIIKIEKIIKNELIKFLITIEDNGHGMNLDDIQTKWVVPSTNNKKKDKLSRSGLRLVQGQKGIGRYSASILGNDFSMNTITDKEKNYIKLDWSAFDVEDKFLDEIEFVCESKENNDKALSGTKIEIISSDNWEDENTLSQLIRELRKLKSPVKNNDEGDEDFKIFMHLVNFSKDKFLSLSSKTGIDWQSYFTNDDLNIFSIKTEILPYPFSEHSHYNLFAHIKKMQIKDILTSYFYPEKCTSTLLKIVENNILKEDAFILVSEMHYTNKKQKDISTVEKYDFINVIYNQNNYCGDVIIDFKCFDLEKDDITNLQTQILPQEDISVNQFRDILRESSGMGIYRNKFRIRPYGDSSSDWLELNKRRINNPSMNLSSNQVIGLVLIGGEKESGLEEKSAREGIKENENFDTLKKICIAALSFLEQQRFIYRKQSKKREKTSSEIAQKIFSFQNLSKNVSTYLEEANISKDIIKNIAELISKDENDRAEQLIRLSKTIATYQNQASLGRLVEFILHEARKPLGSINADATLLERAVNLLIKNLNESCYSQNVTKALDRIKESFLSIKKEGAILNDYFKRLDPLSVQRKVKREVNIIEIFKNSINIFKGALEESNIITEMKSENINCSYLCFEQDIRVIFNNLIENSIHWLNFTQNILKKITVYFEADDNKIKITYTDNGIGIPEENIQNIFNLGFTTKSEGFGMGLTLAGESAKRNNGIIEAISSPTGAIFKIQFNKN
jgi:signal transduction histidine kinase